MSGELPDRICLLNGRVLYVGRLPDLDEHRQAAALVCVGLERPFRVRAQEQVFATRSALVWPQVMHALELDGGLCGFLLVDPDHADFDHLRSHQTYQAAEGIGTDLAHEVELIAAVESIAHYSGAEIPQALLDRLELSPDRAQSPEAIDPRIRIVMEQLVADTGESLPIERLAELADVSPSRLAHLFKEQVGIPIRMFRVWARLKTAALLLQKGSSLTDAAHGAGFYDSAHFANTFRENFGLPPSAIFSPQRRLLWHVTAENRA